jgi:hypothetical protein
LIAASVVLDNDRILKLVMLSFGGRINTNLKDAQRQLADDWFGLEEEGWQQNAN